MKRNLMFCACLGLVVGSIHAAEAAENQIDIGGAVDFNYQYNDASEISRDKTGDIGFGHFKLDVNGSLENILFSAQYRWYSYMNVLHHAWAGYQFTEQLQGQLGVSQVPFGVLPFVDNSYWFGPLFYLGLQDDYDTGAKLIYADGPLNFQVALYKNEEWGDSAKLERSSADVARSGTDQNEETNQFNARVAYTLQHSENYSSELGLSGQMGQLYNQTTSENGDHWAAAAHWLGQYDLWTVTAQVTRYEYNPENPVDVSNETVKMSAYASAYDVPSKANIYTANLARKLEVNWGKLESMTCYTDYSVVTGGNVQDDSKIHVVGCSFGIGPVFTYVDFTRSKNMVFLTSDGIGGEAFDNGWQTLFNINIAYNF